MTIEEIMSKEAGSEMDAAIRKALWPHLSIHKDWSTDPTAATEVLEWVRNLQDAYADALAEAWCSVKAHYENGYGDYPYHWFTYRADQCCAICQVALLLAARMEEERNDGS